MCSIIKIIYLLLALHRVRSKEGAILDYVEGQNDRPLTLESTTILNDQSERAGSTTESVKETTTEMITVDNSRLNTGETRSEVSTEHVVHTEIEGRIAVKENDNNSFESTVSQKTTTDDISSFIEVEEQKAKESSDDDGSEDDVQISDLFGKHSTENESREATGSDSHEATGSDSHKIDSNDDDSDKKDINDDDIITIKIGAPYKNSTEEKTTDYIAASVKPSSKNELVLEDTFKSDTADLLNSSLLTRRMLGGYVVDINGKSSRDSAQVPENLIDNGSHEPQQRRNHKDNHLPPAPTTLSSTGTSTLSLPLEISHIKHINSRLDKPQDEIPTSAIPEVLIPLFRSLRPTKPTLIQQIQPYLQALASTRTPIYNQYQPNTAPIFQRLQQVTQELRLNMAQQYANLYRDQWNPILNNVYNNRNVY